MGQIKKAPDGAFFMLSAISLAECSMVGMCLVGFAYLGTIAQVGLLRKSLSIEGVLDFHRVYAVFAFATPRFDTAASIARAFAAYPPDHVG